MGTADFSIGPNLNWSDFRWAGLKSVYAAPAAWGTLLPRLNDSVG